MPPLDTTPGAASTEGTPANAPETSESAQVDSSASTQTADPGAQTSDASKSAPAPVLDAQGNPVSTPAPYQPKLKYKVSGVEKEFAPYFKDVVKDEKTEKEVRDLYERAAGLDFAKKRETQVMERLRSVEQTHQTLSQRHQILATYLGKGDLESFFDGVKIPEDAIIQYAVERLKLREMSPQDRAIHDRERELRQQAYVQDQRIQQFENERRVGAEQAKSRELATVLERAEVAQAVQAFESQPGREPGAFVMEVAKRAMMLEQLTGKDVSAEQAVSDLLSVLGNSVKPVVPAPQAQIAPSGAAANAPQAGAGAGSQNPPPIIPNVTGRGSASPTQRKFKSFEEMRKHASSLSANEE